MSRLVLSPLTVLPCSKEPSRRRTLCYYRTIRTPQPLAGISIQGNRVLLSFLDLFKIVAIMLKLGRSSDG